LIRVLAGAHEFQENVKAHTGEEQLLKQVDNAIHNELENRFGEKYDRTDDVSDARLNAMKLKCTCP
jgi:translocation protein SEC63